MLGILYLLLCAAFGMSFVGLAVPDVRRLFVACAPSPKAIRHIPNTLFTVPAGIVTGMMCVPFFNYYVTLGLSYVVDSGDLCKRLGVLITFAFFLWMILTCLILINRKRVKREALKASGATAIEDYKFDIVDSIFYGLVTVAITVTATFLMFYTYRIDGSNLMNGYSTFSDLSPHTAMVSSFGKGFNFPTQYMHYSGNGIRYHFMFYFLAGTLEYLGLPIDYALNFPSIISMVCALVLLGLLAVLLSSRRAAFLVAPILVFFRSSLNIFYHIREYMGAGNTFSQTMDEIFASNSWYAVTDYDNWGIWAINVYPNQRHLMLGIAVILLMVILFLPFVRRLGISVSRAESFVDGLKAFIASKNAWLPRSEDPLYPVSITLLACTLVIVMPYFHGSCLIALLLVLFGMAIFSESRLLYLATAVCAVASSYIQTMVFSDGYQNVVTFAFDPGFILEGVTFYSLARYLFIVTGVTLILGGIFALVSLILDIIRKKPVYRFIVFICSLTPMLFAFIFKVSLEMLANHKFIQVSLILVDAFVAALIANLLWIPLKRKKDAVEDEGPADAFAADVAPASAPVSELPEVPAVVSAFGEPVPEIEETPVIEVIEAHTGIDANIAEISGKALESGSSSTETKTEEVKAEETELKEEELPDELHFGDEKKDSDDDEDEDAEAKAGVAALAALFGEIPEDSKEESADKSGEEKPAEESSDNAETTETTETAEAEKETADTESSSETAENKSEDAQTEASASEEIVEETYSEAIANAEEKASEETSEDKPAETAEADKTEDTTEETAESAESDEPVKEAAIEPAHASMRPGSVALSTINFGEDEITPEEAANVEVESAEEASDDSEQLVDESLKHEPVFKEKKAAAGLSLPAWIALEVAGVILALALMVPLTATGVSEWATYVNLNSTPLSVNTNSPVTKWIMENTDPSDVFLTPEWSMNRFILAGRPMYYGWPYYAWSAGHDTYTRETIYLWLITGCGGDIDEFTRYCKERGIKYLIADPEFEQTDFGNGIYFNKRFFEENLTQAAYFAEESTTIYRIY